MYLELAGNPRKKESRLAGHAHNTEVSQRDLHRDVHIWQSKDAHMNKESQLTRHAHNTEASQRDLHRNVHIGQLKDAHRNAAMKLKQEQYHGTEIIQRKMDLSVGSYVSISKDAETTDVIDAIGEICEVREEGYMIIKMGEKEPHFYSKEVARPLHTDIRESPTVVDSVLRNGILSPQAMFDKKNAAVSSGVTTTDSRDSNYKDKKDLHVVGFTIDQSKGLSDAVFTEGKFGAYIIALENGSSPKLMFPSSEECEERLREKVNLPKRDANLDKEFPNYFENYIVLPGYLKHYSEELAAPIKPIMERRLERSMLIITRPTTEPIDLDSPAQELMVKGCIEPEHYLKILLPDKIPFPEERIPKGMEDRVIHVENEMKELPIPIEHFFKPNQGQKLTGCIMNVTLPCPDYQREVLKLGPGKYYSHLVRL